MATIELSVTTINRGHSIYKIQNSSFPIATEGTDLQRAGTRSSGQGCEVNSESFGQNDLHRGREGNTGWSPIASSRKRQKSQSVCGNRVIIWLSLIHISEPT